MFENKTVWVIGAGSDIAKAFLKQYSSCFGRIVLTGRSVHRVQALQEKYQIAHSEVYALDLCSRRSIAAFLKAAPCPDIIVVFAGYLAYRNQTEDVSAQNICRTFAVNAQGVITLVEGALPAMKANGGGTIVALSSCAGERGKASNRIYCAAKAALSVYLQGLVQECRDCNIKVLDVKLARVKTKMLKQAPRKSRLFAVKPQKAAAFVFAALSASRSKVCYQPHWVLPAKLYRAIPSIVYRHLKM